MTETNQVPSPISTGGGGEHFEQHIDAYVLALMLVEAVPPILLDTTLTEVSLQTRHLGWVTDDLLLTGKTGTGDSRKLAMQAKRSFTVSASNTDCKETFSGFWDDYHSPDRFDQSKDKLAIVTLHGTTPLLQHFGSLLDCALASVDADDFSRRLSLDGYLAKKSIEQNEAILGILRVHTEGHIDPGEYWRFLRSIAVISLDLNTTTAIHESLIISLLANQAGDTPDPQSTARETWNALLALSSRARPLAQTFTRTDLPQELLTRHSPILNEDSTALRELIEHGRTVRDSIGSSIAETCEIDRSKVLANLGAEISRHRILVISGIAGSGKSALAKAIATQREHEHLVLAFQAVEFAAAHIDETLSKTQARLNANRLMSLLAGQDRVTIIIESVERLLEHSTRDAFSQLIALSKKIETLEIVLTCREYSVETVRNALLASHYPHCAVFFVPELSTEEQDFVLESVPNLSTPLSTPSLRTFLRTPYLLNMASRLNWSSESDVSNYQEFRNKCWSEIVREDSFSSGGMPQRREDLMLAVSLSRAQQLKPFISIPDVDHEALNALREQSLIVSPPESTRSLSPSHDVLEDWSILQWIAFQFHESDTPWNHLAECVSGYPALRRGFRRWLQEIFESDPPAATRFVLSAIGDNEIPDHFKDDCIVAVLLSDSVATFLTSFEGRVQAGDLDTLRRMIHMLRVACKRTPDWLKVPGLPSAMLVPTGPGWAATLHLVASLKDTLLSDSSLLALGLVEDWAKQIAWNNTDPEGAADSGQIVDALMPLWSEHYSSDSRKRTLEVMLKIPHHTNSFEELMLRAEKGDRSDRNAEDLSSLVLATISNVHACREYPQAVISLANARLRLTEKDTTERDRFSHEEVDHAFGIRHFDLTTTFFPSSALQGPFHSLLQHHPRIGLDFIMDLINHSGIWYGERRWPGHDLEPAIETTILVPDSQPVTQWANSRLYNLYRGYSAGPNVLESSLMALESWLLRIADMDGVDLEGSLLHILRGSNSVMATAVVASVSIAHPEKSGGASIAILSSRELIQLDKARMLADSTSSLQFGFGLNADNFVYDQERKKSNELAHRKEELETLALKLQMSDLRDEVWRVLDQHRSEIHEDDDSEETLIWKLALHRMDIRGYEVVSPPENGNEDATYFGPGAPSPAIQRMIDDSAEARQPTSRYVSILNFAHSVWEDRSCTEANEWRTYLELSQEIECQPGEVDPLFTAGPGIVAAICIRDHLDKLNTRELDWCITKVESEILESAKDANVMTRMQRRALSSACNACAAVSSKICVDTDFSFLETFSIALMHPIEEAANYAYSGASVFLGEGQESLIHQVAASAAHQTNSISLVEHSESHLDYSEKSSTEELLKLSGTETIELFNRQALNLEEELTSLDLDHWHSSSALPRVLDILGNNPNWRESQNFYLKVSMWVADAWGRERHGNEGNRKPDYELMQSTLSSVAKFVLKSPADLARDICHCLFDQIGPSPREFADFLHELILAADGNSEDNFWDLWQEAANRALEAPWIRGLSRERPFEEPLINYLFLNTRWRDDVSHWERLDSNSHRIDQLAISLPKASVCLDAYCRYLSSIGKQSLPESFKVVASYLSGDEATELGSNSNVQFNLERMLKQFVYAEPYLVKSNADLRDSILSILDHLINGGSSSAYHMRDDFVTPLA